MNGDRAWVGVVAPMTAYLVTEGVYGEYRPLAVFTEHRGARDFADHRNLTAEWYSLCDAARVEEINLYGRAQPDGSTRGLPAEVLDPAEVVRVCELLDDAARRGLTGGYYAREVECLQAMARWARRLVGRVRTVAGLAEIAAEAQAILAALDRAAASGDRDAADGGGS